MKSIKTRWRALLLTGTLLLAASAAQAEGCDVITNPVIFRKYDVFRPVALDSTGSIEVTCDAGTKYYVELGPGMHPSSQRPFRPRYMKRVGGVEQLKYQLYTNSARTLVWGDGIHSNTGTCTESSCRATQTSRLVGTRTLTTRKFEVFGRVTMRQNVYAGDYRDVVSVTLKY